MTCLGQDRDRVKDRVRDRVRDRDRLRVRVRARLGVSDGEEPGLRVGGLGLVGVSVWRGLESELGVC